MKKKINKQFECCGECKDLYLDMILLGCNNCIKKTGIDLTTISDTKKNKIIKILNI